MENSHLFCIADFYIRITFSGTTTNSMALLPAFGAFAADSCDNSGLLFSLTVDDTLKPRRDGSLIRKFDTGNGDTIVYLLPDGGYQYIIRDTSGRDCSLLQTDRHFTQCQCALNGTWNMRSFGLNDALMLVFAFAASRHGALLIHASCIKNGEWAYPFTAQSGTGKSTHTGLWMNHIPNSELLNDDNPVIRITDDGNAFAYGSPWSGKTPCYRNIKARLGAITKIERAPENSIERMKGVSAFAMLLPACSSMKWDSHIYGNICDTVTRLAETVPAYTLHCLPDKEAALLCHSTIARDEHTS